MPHQRRPTEKPQAALVTLTRREIEVLQLLAEGLSNKEIADKLTVSPCTIKTHLHSIYKKLNVYNRTSAVYEAIRVGVILLQKGGEKARIRKDNLQPIYTEHLFW